MLQLFSLFLHLNLSLNPQTLFVSAYVLGDGSSLIFYDASKSVIPDSDSPPIGSYELTFSQVSDMNAYTQYPYSATLKLTPAFFMWMCPTHCGGLTSSQFLGLAVPDSSQQPDCNDSTPTQATASGGGGSGTYSTTMKDIKTNEGNDAWRKRCLFWHVNIHSCPTILSTGKAAFCTPYLGESVTTHTPAQAIIGQYSQQSGQTKSNDVLVTANFNVEITTIDKLATDYMTIAHFKFGVGSTLSIAAGWNHKIFSFADKTKCPSGYVPNPDGTCGVCGPGMYANQPTIDINDMLYNYADNSQSQLATVKSKVDNSTWTLSSFSNDNYCVQCPRGSYKPQSSPISSMAVDQCIQCPVGHYTDQLGTTSSCTPCPPGHYQDNVGQSVCFPCSTGTYQSKSGQSKCRRAPNGFFVDSKAAIAPTRCPHNSMTTNGEGSASKSECMCSSGYYMEGLEGQPLKEIGTHCESCPDGFECAGGRVVVGGNSSGDSEIIISEDDMEESNWRHKLPVLKPGFYSERHKPYDAYDCRNDKRCPGGNEPGYDYTSISNPICTENADKSAINCGRCENDYHFSDNMTYCNKCGGQHYLFFILLIIFFIAAFIVIYHVANSPITVEMSPLLSASISLGVTLSIMQALGVIGSLALSWPSPLKEIMGVLKLLVVDLEAFGSFCVTGDDPLAKLIGRQSLPIIIVTVYGFGYYILGCERHKCINSAGMLCVGLFSAFSVAGFAPFACYSGPNDKSVMLSEPSVLCDFNASGHNYLGLWTVGFITFLAYPIGGLIFIIVKIKNAPEASLDDEFLKTYRFLFYRFRPDKFYWMPILLLRNTSIAFPAVIFSESQSQCMAVVCILLISLVTQIRVWPWRSNALNYFDSVSICCIILLLCFWFPTAPQVNNTKPYTTGGFLVMLFLFCFTCFIFSSIFYDMLKDMGIFLKSFARKSDIEIMKELSTERNSTGGKRSSFSQKVEGSKASSFHDKQFKSLPGSKASSFHDKRARYEVLQLIMSHIRRWRHYEHERECKMEVDEILEEFSRFDLQKAADVFFLMKLQIADTVTQKKQLIMEAQTQNNNITAKNIFGISSNTQDSITLGSTKGVDHAQGFDDKSPSSPQHSVLRSATRIVVNKEGTSQSRSARQSNFGDLNSATSRHLSNGGQGGPGNPGTSPPRDPSKNSNLSNSNSNSQNIPLKLNQNQNQSNQNQSQNANIIMGHHKTSNSMGSIGSMRSHSHSVSTNDGALGPDPLPYSSNSTNLNIVVTTPRPGGSGVTGMPNNNVTNRNPSVFSSEGNMGHGDTNMSTVIPGTTVTGPVSTVIGNSAMSPLKPTATLD